MAEHDKNAHNSKTVLVVDDTALSRLSTVMLVESLGYAADQAEGALEALDMLKARDYAAILMDYQMPGMNGIDCTKSIRQSNDGIDANIPIIALTSGTGEVDLESRCMAAGMNAYLLKTSTAEHIGVVLNRFVPQ